MVIITSLPPPTEGIVHKEQRTSANLQGRDMGLGTLFIAESRLAWTDTSGKGFSLEYPGISLHAVSRDTSSFPHECLYVMVDAKIEDSSVLGTKENDTEDDDEDEAQITEIRFIPEDKGSLDAMFDAMAACQSLHPDEDDSNSEDSENYEDADEVGEGDGEWFTGEEGVGHLTAEGQATLQRLENLMTTGHSNHTDDMETGDHTNTTQTTASGTGETEAMETSGGQFDDAEPDH
ncbi:methylosome subunit pICln-like isoform X2 [Glandiceps talaboti]